MSLYFVLQYVEKWKRNYKLAMFKELLVCGLFEQTCVEEALYYVAGFVMFPFFIICNQFVVITGLSNTKRDLQLFSSFKPAPFLNRPQDLHPSNQQPMDRITVPPAFFFLIIYYMSHYVRNMCHYFVKIVIFVGV